MYSKSLDGIISTNCMTALGTSLICTVYNEEKNIGKLIDSISQQSVKPNEVLIVDGGSKDKTIEIIKAKVKEYPHLRFKFFYKRGNRSVGRNEAIKKSSYNIIISTDAGCVLDKKWVENIIKPFQDKSIDVIAGYYKGRAQNAFEKSLIPYVLVMDDRVESSNFLPATRSMAFKKYVWSRLKGFNESLSHNEDYEFANRLKKQGFKITFEKKAVVYWVPRKDIFQSFKMFTRFAYGDIESGLLRNKVIYIFLRYLFGLYLIALCVIMKSERLNMIVIITLISYLVWSIAKNYKYVNDIKAVLYLPVLQFTSDIAVIFGSTTGIFKRISLKSIAETFKNNKAVTAIIALYILIMVLMIDWGIPNTNHPFNYFMDEWHQVQSVRNLFTLGSPNVEGSANGSIFHFFLSGIYLVPFIIFGIVEPTSIESSISNLDVQKVLFEILRLNTLAFGVLSILTFYYLSKKFFNSNPVVSTLVFVFNPVWLMLSNYFKYDIALMFWTLLSFIFMFRYIKNPNFRDLFMYAIISAIALSVKLSPFALPVIIIVAFFAFTQNSIKRLSWILTALIVYATTFLILGIPDILLGKGSLYEYLSSVLIRTPNFNASNLVLDQNIWIYLVTNVYSALFGYVLLLGSTLYLVIGSIRIIASYLIGINVKHLISKETTIIVLSFILFAFSLYPLKLDATNNRALTLLPFFAIFFGIFWTSITRFIKSAYIKIILISILLLIQMLQALSWVNIKLSSDPRYEASKWIVSNLKPKSTIGIENIPIYQSLPDVVVKEFYIGQYGLQQTVHFKYKVINSNQINLPEYVVLTNDQIAIKYFKKSEKKEIVKELDKMGYKKITSFKPYFKYLKYFTNDINYYLTAIVQSPTEINIYEK